MIGKAYKSLVPYFDKRTNKNSFKGRPCLIIGKADASDYVVLPISTIPDKTKIDPNFDIPLDKSIYTFLNQDSYLRTHKQTIVNTASLRDQLADFKVSYEETYIEAMLKFEEFNKNLIANAL